MASILDIDLWRCETYLLWSRTVVTMYVRSIPNHHILTNQPEYFRSMKAELASIFNTFTSDIYLWSWKRLPTVIKINSYVVCMIHPGITRKLITLNVLDNRNVKLSAEDLTDAVHSNVDLWFYWQYLTLILIDCKSLFVCLCL